MLQEQDCVADLAGVAGSDESFLEVKRRSVICATEMDEVEDHAGHAGARWTPVA